ncbi:MAG TPA: Zn-dependent hydrolase [Candidatus Eisenbacteria bacterium]|nr:Zn-dependent hydrolase [Candidatus Eisenbacteria bacterium]
MKETKESAVAPPVVDGARLWSTLMSLGRIGETPRGMDRIAFSPSEIEARAFVTGLLREAGLATRIDAAGNLIATKPGVESGLRPIAMGSHIDTVPMGGKFDGALGVLGAIEVVRTLADRGLTTRHPLEVIAFTNEEGGRFHRGLFGSRAMAGLLVPDDLTVTDDEGKGLAEHLAAVGGDRARLAEAVRRPGSLAGYLEYHIEQGPELERDGKEIGVVTGITGRFVLEVDIQGMTNHAGTTPMDLRRDAMVAAAHVALAVEGLARQKTCRVGTLGVVQVKPGAVNVIPGFVHLEAEFRDLEMARLEETERRFADACREIASDTHTTIAVKRQEIVRSAPTAPGFRGAVESVSRSLGYTTMAVPSGAGHDAQAIAELTEIGMIFVPSQAGISHAIEEFTPAEDCARGANVLLGTLLELDGKLP